MVGTTLNHYRIVRLLGSGGMGEVFAAEDLKLQRPVALKILPKAVASDPERRERFEREARAVAALNHPNIVTIYSVEETSDLTFLTMEIVDGKPLSELIPAGGLSIDRILKLAILLADALAAAHDRGIVHRDVKPANIMVTGDGRVKVLDFGLAKLRPEPLDAAAATTLDAPPITGKGHVLGTTAYMSPEQAEGKSVDHRSDIFSLGVTLYEMATGQRPFQGDTGVSIISSILKDTPRPITEINRALPRELGRIVRRTLTKDPEHRFQSAKDLRNELEELKESLVSGEVAAPSDRSDGATTWLRTMRVYGPIGILLGVAFGATALWMFWSNRQSAGPLPRHAEAVFAVLTSQTGVEHFANLSPDGKWFLYTGDASGNDDVYLQSVGGQTPINLTKDSAAADRQAVFSADGERIAFRSERDGGGIFVMGRTGEAVTRITNEGFNPAWSPDGDEIVYASQGIVANPGSRGPSSTLSAINLRTHEKRQLTTTADAVQPSWSPHRHRIAFWTAHGPGRQRDIATISAAGGEPLFVTNDGAVDWNPVWSPDGKYLYFSSDRAGTMNLWRVPIDESSGNTLGAPEAITTPSKFAGHLSVSADGRRLVYSSMEFSQNIERVVFDPKAEAAKGAPTPVTSGSRLWHPWASASPDGQSIALGTVSPQEDLFIARADGSGLRQLTNDAALDRAPAWSPDGKRIAFQTNRSGAWDAWSINPDGSGLVQLSKGIVGHRPKWAPDGSQMVASHVNINQVVLFDPRKPWENQTPEILPSFDDGVSWIVDSWSPDGRLLAGSSARGGIGVYALLSKTYQRLTDAGPGLPLWLADGRRLLFTSAEGAIVLIDTASRRQREILRLAGSRLATAGLSQDNQLLYVHRATTTADIWMATLK
jgi:Tol biopolymer transport system component